MTVFLTVLVGVLSSLVISLRLARPVRKLSGEVEAVQKNNSTSLQFSDTGIRELDQFADAIIQMNQDMITISTKFLRIMEMASVELGGRILTAAVPIRLEVMAQKSIVWSMPEEKSGMSVWR